MSDRQRVLVTGASGEIASQILPELGRGHEVVPVDVRSTDRQGRPVQGVQLADLTDPDRSRYQRHFEGVDVVVHLGYKHPGTADWGADLRPIERFEGELLIFGWPRMCTAAPSTRGCVESSWRAPTMRPTGTRSP